MNKYKLINYDEINFKYDLSFNVEYIKVNDAYIKLVENFVKSCYCNRFYKNDHIIINCNNIIFVHKKVYSKLWKRINTNEKAPNFNSFILISLFKYKNVIEPLNNNIKDLYFIQNTSKENDYNNGCVLLPKSIFDRLERIAIKAFMKIK